ncbi:MAG: 50S ribosomal protein L9 [Deltaproteobacteria bacterium]|nr:50S ribosomal protein L9 [Deltaproteobacteria bacterium]
MKVILTQDVHNLGKAGDLVTVKPGYGRNYLIPRTMAVLAGTAGAKQIEHQKMVIAQSQEKSRREAQKLSDRVENASCTIRVEVGEQEKLYGSVTARDIEHALAEEGLRLDRKQIVLDEPIKALGVYAVNVKLHRDVTAKLKVWVVAK